MTPQAQDEIRAATVSIGPGTGTGPILAYLRVSTQLQEEQNTIDQQRTAINDWMRTQPFTLAGEFADNGVSGAIPLDERPQGAALLEALQGSTVKHVVMLCPDRLGRDTVSALLAMDEFKRLKVEVHFTSQSFDDTPEGEFMFQTMMNVAQLEKALIRRRTMKGKHAAVRAGKKAAAEGKAYITGASVLPHGYKRVPVTDANGNQVLKENGRVLNRIEIDHDAAQDVHEIHRLYHTGLRTQAIATMMQNSGRPWPGKARNKGQGWWGGRILKILTNESYTGTGVFRPGDPNRKGRKLEDTIDTSYPPILSDDVFKRTAEILADSKRGERADKLTMLQGKVWCFCGSRLTPTAGYYRCTSVMRFDAVRIKHEGKRRSFKAEALERTVQTFIDKFFADPRFLAAHVERQFAADQQALESTQDEVNAIRARIADRKSRREHLLDLAEQGRGK